jgi:heme-degrading monooxygenase HmoA
MPYMLVRHKVEDYERWKPGFEEDGATRKESGSKGVRLFRNADDPSETVILLEWDDLAQTVILLEWDDLENARQFAQSDDLRETMQRVGVADQPDIFFLEEVETVED